MVLLQLSTSRINDIEDKPGRENSRVEDKLRSATGNWAESQPSERSSMFSPRSIEDRSIVRTAPS